MSDEDLNIISISQNSATAILKVNFEPSDKHLLSKLGMVY